ncbi:MAG: HIT family protein [Vicinamibacteria bacterium]|nr:HIT family protein [Vicinamibacteria bacterium]
MKCALCGIASGAIPAPGPAPLARGPFLVHAKLEPGAHAGWLLVVPRRHVEQVAELTDEEARGLGPLLRETAAALRAETGAAKTYVACFAEVVPHLHFHVIARAGDAPEDARGPRAFLAAAPEPADEAARAALAARVLARLQPADSRFRPLLLSGLLWPGAGQVVAGRRRFGGALAIAAAVVCVLLIRALVAETLLRMPTDPVFFDDFGSIVALSQRLAAEIRPALAPYLWTLLGLWLAGCVEAAVRIVREPR